MQTGKSSDVPKPNANVIKNLSQASTSRIPPTAHPEYRPDLYNQSSRTLPYTSRTHAEQRELNLKQAREKRMQQQHAQTQQRLAQIRDSRRMPHVTQQLQRGRPNVPHSGAIVRHTQPPLIHLNTDSASFNKLLASSSGTKAAKANTPLTGTNVNKILTINTQQKTVRAPVLKTIKCEVVSPKPSTSTAPVPTCSRQPWDLPPSVRLNIKSMALNELVMKTGSFGKVKEPVSESLLTELERAQLKKTLNKLKLLQAKNQGSKQKYTVILKKRGALASIQKEYKEVMNACSSNLDKVISLMPHAPNDILVDEIENENRKRAKTTLNRQKKYESGFHRGALATIPEEVINANGDAVQRPVTTVATKTPLYYQCDEAVEFQKEHEKAAPIIQKLAVLMAEHAENIADLRDERNQNYEALTAEWHTKQDRAQRNTRKNRDDRSRLLYEQLFPEIKRARESKARKARSETRPKTEKEARQAAIDAKQAVLDEKKKLYGAAALPPLMEGYDSAHLPAGKIIENPLKLSHARLSEFLKSWSESERRIFQRKFKKYGKNFAMLAACIGSKSTRDCVRFFYLTKQHVKYKLLHKLKRRKTGKTYRPVGIPTEGEYMHERCRAYPFMRTNRFEECLLCIRPIPVFAVPKFVDGKRIPGEYMETVVSKVVICDHCHMHARKSRAANFSKCPLKSCSLGRRRTKPNRTIPDTLKKLKIPHKCFIINRRKIHPDYAKCCGSCIRKIQQDFALVTANKMNFRVLLFNRIGDLKRFRIEHLNVPRWSAKNVLTLRDAILTYGIDDWFRVAQLVNVEKLTPWWCYQKYVALTKDGEWFRLLNGNRSPPCKHGEDENAALDFLNKTFRKAARKTGAKMPKLVKQPEAAAALMPPPNLVNTIELISSRPFTERDRQIADHMYREEVRKHLVLHPGSVLPVPETDTESESDVAVLTAPILRVPEVVTLSPDPSPPVIQQQVFVPPMPPIASSMPIPASMIKREPPSVAVEPIPIVLDNDDDEIQILEVIPPKNVQIPSGSLTQGTPRTSMGLSELTLQQLSEIPLGTIPPHISPVLSATIINALQKRHENFIANSMMGSTGSQPFFNKPNNSVPLYNVPLSPLAVKQTTSTSGITTSHLASAVFTPSPPVLEKTPPFAPSLFEKMATVLNNVQSLTESSPVPGPSTVNVPPSPEPKSIATPAEDKKETDASKLKSAEAKVGSLASAVIEKIKNRFTRMSLKKKVNFKVDSTAANPIQKRKEKNTNSSMIASQNLKSPMFVSQNFKVSGAASQELTESVVAVQKLKSAILATEGQKSPPMNDAEATQTPSQNPEDLLLPLPSCWLDPNFPLDHPENCGVAVCLREFFGPRDMIDPLVDLFASIPVKSAIESLEPTTEIGIKAKKIIDDFLATQFRNYSLNAAKETVIGLQQFPPQFPYFDYVPTCSAALIRALQEEFQEKVDVQEVKRKSGVGTAWFHYDDTQAKRNALHIRHTGLSTTFVDSDKPSSSDTTRIQKEKIVKLMSPPMTKLQKERADKALLNSLVQPKKRGGQRKGFWYATQLLKTPLTTNGESLMKFLLGDYGTEVTGKIALKAKAALKSRKERAALRGGITTRFQEAALAETFGNLRDVNIDELRRAQNVYDSTSLEVKITTEVIPKTSQQTPVVAEMRVSPARIIPVFDLGRKPEMESIPFIIATPLAPPKEVEPCVPVTISPQAVEKVESTVEINAPLICSTTKEDVSIADKVLNSEKLTAVVATNDDNGIKLDAVGLKSSSIEAGFSDTVIEPTLLEIKENEKELPVSPKMNAPSQDVVPVEAEMETRTITELQSTSQERQNILDADESLALAELENMVTPIGADHQHEFAPEPESPSSSVILRSPSPYPPLVRMNEIVKTPENNVDSPSSPDQLIVMEALDGPRSPSPADYLLDEEDSEHVQQNAEQSPSLPPQLIEAPASPQYALEKSVSPKHDEPTTGENVIRMPLSPLHIITSPEIIADTPASPDEYVPLAYSSELVHDSSDDYFKNKNSATNSYYEKSDNLLATYRTRKGVFQGVVQTSFELSLPLPKSIDKTNAKIQSPISEGFHELRIVVSDTCLSVGNSPMYVEPIFNDMPLLRNAEDLLDETSGSSLSEKPKVAVSSTTQDSSDDDSSDTLSSSTDDTSSDSSTKSPNRPLNVYLPTRNPRIEVPQQQFIDDTGYKKLLGADVRKSKLETLLVPWTPKQKLTPPKLKRSATVASISSNDSTKKSVTKRRNLDQLDKSVGISPKKLSPDPKPSENEEDEADDEIFNATQATPCVSFKSAPIEKEPVTILVDKHDKDAKDAHGFNDMSDYSDDNWELESTLSQYESDDEYL